MKYSEICLLKLCFTIVTCDFNNAVPVSYYDGVTKEKHMYNVLAMSMKYVKCVAWYKTDLSECGYMHYTIGTESLRIYWTFIHW